jgi:uncharacterized phage infection (PIP) family protein YhgE
MEVELLNKIIEKIEHLDGGMNSLRNEMNEKFDRVDVKLNGIDTRLDGIDTRLDGIETTTQRIETGQQEDIHSILTLINKKLEDTATKADIADLRQDIEFNIRENSLFKLELDRIKRNNYE